MGALAALVVKDIREVATSRYFMASLVAGFVVLVALGAAVGASFREAAAEMQKFAAVVNQTTRLGEVYVEELRRLGGDVYEAFSPDLLQRYIYVVVVPPNFTFPSRVEVYAKYRGLLSVAAPPAVERAAAEAARRMGLPPRLVNVTTLLNLDGVCLSGADLALLNSLFLVTWLFMVVVPLSVATTAAVAIGIEKEKKTFELILATPATPGVLVAAKLISSTALALLQLAVTAAGMLIYLANVGAGVAASAQAAAEVRQLPLFVFSPTLLLPVVLSTLALALAVVAVSLLVATKTEDVKTAQGVVPSVVFPLVLPALAALFTPGLDFYPFVHPLAVATAALVEKWGKVYLYLAVDWALAAAALLATSKLLTTEYLVAGRRRP